MVHYKLTFFDNRGLAECIRLMFHYAGVEFEDNRISHEAWLKLKPATLTGKVPILEMDQRPLPESGAICRYLAPKLGLASPDPFENAQMEAVIESLKDFNNDIKPYFISAFGGCPGENDKLYKEVYLPISDKYFTRLTNIITSSKSGFLADSGITWGDLYLAEDLTTFQTIDPQLGTRFPKLVEYERKIHGLPRLQAYVARRKTSTV